MYFHRAIEAAIRLAERNNKGMDDTILNREHFVRELSFYLRMMKVKGFDIRVDGRNHPKNILMGSVSIPHENKFEYFDFSFPVIVNERESKVPC